MFESSKSITCFNYELDLLNFACIMLFIGAVGKSGQFGLHAWLPEAMNAQHLLVRYYMRLRW
jgi:NADH-quinone oxidoreductase subunit L